MMRNSDAKSIRQQTNSTGCAGKRAETALSILTDLKAALGKAEGDDAFRFLAYLLRMAVVEAQAVASRTERQEDA